MGGLVAALLPALYPGLHAFCFKLPEGKIVVYIRDLSARYGLNYQMGEHFEEGGLLATKPVIKTTKGYLS